MGTSMATRMVDLSVGDYAFFCLREKPAEVRMRDCHCRKLVNDASRPRPLNPNLSPARGERSVAVPLHV
jgi:hypothetical protein